MRHQKFSKPALAFLIAGLLLITLTPLVGRHFHLPDFAIGCLNGLGLACEAISLGIMQKNRKRKCQIL
ncbi:hypothetical protein [Mucilaginibacter ginkgonis]|uniref:Uncharacterized protein n=1 Tax=Mucilaginibacter ginkgonis TaxID=2682091 RepID=A0A7T7FAV2_9SPHI|nr:hypothetical protein [Mucilaginibacter ginkgonis]QQL49942.1 hypothetical protein GO620_000380 [Mucilaginibacter ginkgonis]